MNRQLGLFDANQRQRRICGASVRPGMLFERAGGGRRAGVPGGQDDLERANTDYRLALVAHGAEPAAPESALLAFRRAEFNVLRTEVNDPARIPNLRVVRSQPPSGLAVWFEKVNLVERLRETRVFYGFDRLQPSSSPLDGMPDSAMTQLFREPPDQPQERWLPAAEVFGEGIYFELREDRIRQWQQDCDAWLRERLGDQFVIRLADVFQTLPPLGTADRGWASRYLLVHSLAHSLINQFVFECGYSTASLRERLYVSADAKAPMAGILIYTAAGDSVRAGGRRAAGRGPRRAG